MPHLPYLYIIPPTDQGLPEYASWTSHFRRKFMINKLLLESVGENLKCYSLRGELNF